MDRGDGHASDRIHEDFGELRDDIMQTPATCCQDVAVKLHLYANIMDIVDWPEDLPEMGDNAAEGYLRTAICDLERLDGESLTGAGVGPDQTASRQAHAAPSGDEEFFALIGEFESAREACMNMVPSAAGEVLSERAQALDQKMLETRARTLAGVGWKLRELTRLLDDEPGVSVYERRLAHSALTDVDALAGEG